MKVIISHDVDHLTVWEHLMDGILLKFWLRNSMGLLAGTVSPANIRSMLTEMLDNRWQYIDALTQFDREHGIPASYFVGVNNGYGLSYSLSSASTCIQSIRRSGFDVGVHGIGFDNFLAIQEERSRFQNIAELNDFGIRIHNLRMGHETLADLAKAGYSFDTSEYQIHGPYKLNGIVEFPLHLMDVRVFEQGHKYKTVSLKRAKEFTCKVIDQVEQTSLPYLTILFHDRYFCNAFSKWREWYIWLIETLKGRGLEFISYRTACQEVNRVGAERS